jgi:putative ABC transport system substrate-binding protein
MGFVASVVQITRLSHGLRGMIDRRTAFLTLGALACGARLSLAQPAGKPPRIGIAVGTDAFYDAFLQALGEAGWINGRNIVVERRTILGRRDQIPKLVAETMALNVDVIVASSPPTIAAFKRATSTIPIVAIDFESDPVASGFIAGFPRPGGNITGVFVDLPELAGKQLEFLKETVPGLARVAVLWDTDIGGHQFQATKDAARLAGLSLEPIGFLRSEDLAPAFDRAVRARAQAVVILTSPVIAHSRKHIGELTLKRRLPTISPFTWLPEAGILMAYGPSLQDIYRRAAGYVDRILKGANAGDLPVERPSKFELVINLRTAEALGVAIPQSLMQRADRVIQ